MILKRTDLPLYQDSHSRFLPWLVAFMIFLAVFGLASIIVLKEVAKRWDRGVSGTISVQIPAAAEASDDEKTKARRVALLASRTNVMLSIPMLLLMTNGLTHKHLLHI